MATSCNTHAYDGKLRDKWFEIRPMLLEKYLPNCLSFEDTLNEIEQWLDKKYFNVKRIGRARRSLKILTNHRKSNFDSRNDIDVEELLPILWNQVKNQADIHDTFYEQLCDITGGSCSQGRSTRLFQFLFLFDLPTETTNTNDQSDPPQTTTTVNNPQDSSKPTTTKTDDQSDPPQTTTTVNNPQDPSKPTTTKTDDQSESSQTTTTVNNPKDSSKSTTTKADDQQESPQTTTTVDDSQDSSQITTNDDTISTNLTSEKIEL